MVSYVRTVPLIIALRSSGRSIYFFLDVPWRCGFILRAPDLAQDDEKSLPVRCRGGTVQIWNDGGWQGLGLDIER